VVPGGILHNREIDDYRTFKINTVALDLIELAGDSARDKTLSKSFEDDLTAIYHLYFFLESQGCFAGYSG
jgi:hypothetical protein